MGQEEEENEEEKADDVDDDDDVNTRNNFNPELDGKPVIINSTLFDGGERGRMIPDSGN